MLYPAELRGLASRLPDYFLGVQKLQGQCAGERSAQAVRESVRLNARQFPCRERRLPIGIFIGLLLDEAHEDCYEAIGR
jgi:hypothetical protein